MSRQTAEVAGTGNPLADIPNAPKHIGQEWKPVEQFSKRQLLLIRAKLKRGLKVDPARCGIKCLDHTPQTVIEELTCKGPCSRVLPAIEFSKTARRSTMWCYRCVSWKELQGKRSAPWPIADHMVSSFERGIGEQMGRALAAYDGYDGASVSKVAGLCSRRSSKLTSQIVSEHDDMASARSATGSLWSEHADNDNGCNFTDDNTVRTYSEMGGDLAQGAKRDSVQGAVQARNLKSRHAPSEYGDAEHQTRALVGAPDAPLDGTLIASARAGSVQVGMAPDGCMQSPKTHDGAASVSSSPAGSEAGDDDDDDDDDEFHRSDDDSEAGGGDNKSWSQVHYEYTDSASQAESHFTEKAPEGVSSRMASKKSGTPKRGATVSHSGSMARGSVHLPSSGNTTTSSMAGGYATSARTGDSRKSSSFFTSNDHVADWIMGNSALDQLDRGRVTKHPTESSGRSTVGLSESSVWDRELTLVKKHTLAPARPLGVVDRRAEAPALSVPQPPPAARVGNSNLNNRALNVTGPAGARGVAQVAPTASSQAVSQYDSDEDDDNKSQETSRRQSNNRNWGKPSREKRTWVHTGAYKFENDTYNMTWSDNESADSM